MSDLDRTFRLLTGHDRMLAWQRRLLLDWFRKGRLPDEIDMPSGLGKTSIMALWLMALAEQLGEGREDRLPLRYVHLVDGRAQVDQASVEAERLARNLGLRPGLEWMRRALGLDRERLPVSTLHGGMAGSSRWLADPAAPAIIVGTAEDMVSRFLFDGGGLSPRMRSVHAAMLGVDSLMVVDEIRLVPRFLRLLVRLVREGAQSLWPPAAGIRRPKLLPMSATGCGAGAVFRLEAADLEDPEIVRRLEAVRHLRLERSGAGDGGGDVLAARLADAAWRLACGDRGAAGLRTVVFCDDAEVARRVHDMLRARPWPDGEVCGGEILLLANGRRGLERHALAERLGRAGFLPNGSCAHAVPVILVTASTAAESMDLEADRMVCDIVPLERMVLRFGRLVRRAERGNGCAVVVVDGMMLARSSGARAERLEGAVRVLERLGADASQAAFMRLREREPDLFWRGVSPDPYPPWLEVALNGRVSRIPLDRRGPEEDDPDDEAVDSEILWRAHLPWRLGAPEPDAADVARYLVAAAPHPLEGLKTKASAVAALLIRRAGAVLGRSGAGAEAVCGPADAGAILLSTQGEFETAFTMGELAEMSVADLEKRIGGGTILCAAGLGGLDAEGRLDPEIKERVATVDAGWPEDWEWCLGFRIRRVAGDGLCRLERGWNRFFVMDLGGGGGEAGDFLVIDVLSAMTGGKEEGGRVPGGGRRRLVAAEVARLVERLHLPAVPARALELAGAWLDLGRAHTLWRRAFSAMPRGDGRSGWRSGRGRNGFQDGWGPLFDMMERIMPTDLDGEIRDLVHHLADGHAGAVPLASEGKSESRARLGRLEERYGKWGLAWLEALLWVAECRTAPEESPPCWRGGCLDGMAGRGNGRR